MRSRHRAVPRSLQRASAFQTPSVPWNRLLIANHMRRNQFCPVGGRKLVEFQLLWPFHHTLSASSTDTFLMVNGVLTGPSGRPPGEMLHRERGPALIGLPSRKGPLQRLSLLPSGPSAYNGPLAAGRPAAGSRSGAIASPSAARRRTFMPESQALMSTTRRRWKFALLACSSVPGHVCSGASGRCS